MAEPAKRQLGICIAPDKQFREIGSDANDRGPNAQDLKMYALTLVLEGARVLKVHMRADLELF